MLMSAPRMASTTEIYLSITEFTPSLRKRGCFRTATFTTKSPLTWPLPLNRNWAPLSMPLGILNYSFDLMTSTPSPEQWVQGCPMVCPLPLQLPHSVLMTMMPWWKVMKPVPLQVLHFWGFVPGLALEPLQTLQLHLRLI